MVTFLSLAVLRLVGAARAEDDVVAAIDARADEFAEAAGGTGFCICAFWGIGSRRWIIASREWRGGSFPIGPLAHSRNTSCVPPRAVLRVHYPVKYETVSRLWGRLENLNAPHSVCVYSTPIK